MPVLRRLAMLVFAAALALAPAIAWAQESQVAQANPFPAPVGKPAAQPQQGARQVATGEAVGSVASATQPATVARAGNAAVALKKGDAIRQGDRLATGAGGALGVTFDDETTFSLSANAALTVDQFVYRPGQRGSASIRVVRGTAGFVAAQVAKQGDMKITTPNAILGIRGTTGIVEVPASASSNVRLYQDADGRVGRIAIYGRNGARVGELTEAETGYALQMAGQQLVATALTITAEQLLRDRNIVKNVFSFRGIGREFNIRRLRDLAPGNLDPRNLPRQVPGIPGIPGIPGLPGIPRLGR